jgi:hypothetical protein
MRIRLEYAADWISSNGRRHIQIPAGEHTVKREVGEALVSRGVAVEVKPPGKDAD